MAVEYENPPTPLPTLEQVEMMKYQAEIDKGVEDANLMDVDTKLYMEVLCTDISAIYWRLTFCGTCSKPKIVHTTPGARNCTRTMIPQIIRTRYKLACESNKVMDMVAHILAAQTREERVTLA